MADADGAPSSVPPATLAILGGLVAVLVGGFLLLTLAGRDASAYTLFVSGPVVTSVVGVIISRRVHKVEQIATVVQAQTNGQLTAQVQGVHEHLDVQTGEILAGITSPPAETQKAGPGKAGLLPVQRSIIDVDLPADSGRHRG